MNETRRKTDGEQMAMTVDPVITWLEQCRDFMGSTPQAKDMAQRAIDRLRPPAIDVWAVVGALVDDLGTLRVSSGGALVSDRPNHPSASADDAGYYGGYLVGESIMPRNAIAMSFLPQLLVAARENPAGRAVLAQLAQALSTPPVKRDKVRDRLDGSIRIARLADEFQAGSRLDDQDELYMTAELLKVVGGALLTQALPAGREDIEAWLERRREARRSR
jgi:hypothetical protein